MKTTKKNKKKLIKEQVGTGVFSLLATIIVPALISAITKSRK